MTGRTTGALKVPSIVPYKALEKFSKALHGTMGSTYSAQVFRPVMVHLSSSPDQGVCVYGLVTF